VELYFHSPNTPSWRGAQLKKHRQLYLYLEEQAKPVTSSAESVKGRRDVLSITALSGW
jgi:hypothetical protein